MGKELQLNVGDLREFPGYSPAMAQGCDNHNRHRVHLWLPRAIRLLFILIATTFAFGWRQGICQAENLWVSL